MRGKEISATGLLSAAFICLVATAISMANIDRMGPLALALFSIAWLVFYVSVAMPFKFKKRERSETP